MIMRGLRQNSLLNGHYLHGSDFRLGEREIDTLVVKNTHTGSTRPSAYMNKVGNKKLHTFRRSNLEGDKGSGVLALSDLLDHTGHIDSIHQMRCLHRNNVRYRQNSVKTIILTHDDAGRIGQSKDMIAGGDNIFLSVARTDFEGHKRDGV